MSALLFFNTLPSLAAQAIPDELNQVIANITGFSTCCVKFKIGDKTLYTDPCNIPHEDKADIILLSHNHSDHFSITNIKKILTKDSVIVAPVSFIDTVNLLFKVKTIAVKPGDLINVGGIEIQVVPAYENKLKLHLKEYGFAGYLFKMNHALIYFAGETDVIPEMEQIKADVALLPIDRRASMNPEDAAALAIKMNPKFVIPMHYISSDDVAQFSGLIKDQITVVDKGLSWRY